MQGISLGTIYAKVMIDASTMASGIADVRRQLEGLEKGGASTINNISNSTRNVSVEMNNLSGAVRNVTVNVKEAAERSKQSALEQVYALRTIGYAYREI